MRIFYIIVIVFLFGSNISAENRQVLDNFPKKIPNSANSWNLRNIDGVFEFDKLPEPLKFSTVKFTLKIINIPKIHENIDWTIKLTNSNKHYEVMFDSSLVWAAPHTPGDTFTGTFKFKPLTSGRKNLKLWVPEIMNDFFIYWIIDEKGNLLELDNRWISKNKYESLEVVFFENDSVIFRDDNDLNDEFKHYVIITPLPKIGEVSEVIINNDVNYLYNAGMDIDLMTKNITISELPDFIDYAVYPGQKSQIKFKIVPDSVNYNHQIFWHNYYYRNNTKVNSNLLTLSIYMVFNEDGSLRFISDRNPYYDKDKLIKYNLKSFKDPDLTSWKQISITKEGEIKIDSF